jgi:hypothetical protein
MVALNSTMVPSSLVSLIALLAHRMTTSYFLHQSMPRMMSMPLESRMMKFARKSTPLILILIVGHICFVLISPPGELTSMVCFIIVMGRWCFAANVDDTKECDAPKSNKTVADVSLQETYPILCLELIRLPRLSHGWPCRRYSSTVLEVMTSFLILEQTSCWDTIERDDRSYHT